MPQSSQNLYFHFGMNADDDGFCEHFGIMRMTESKPVDLQVLHQKGFVQVFDDKVLIIKDWKENNYLRNDRYTPSKYLEIYKEEIKALTEGESNTGIPAVYHLATQVRVGKVRKGKVIDIYTPDFLSFYDAYPKHVEKKKAFTIWERRELPEEEVAKIMDFLKEAKKTKKWREGFIPNPTTFLNGDIWNDDLSAYGGVDKKGGEEIWV